MDTSVMEEILEQHLTNGVQHYYNHEYVSAIALLSELELRLDCNPNDLVLDEARRYLFLSYCGQAQALRHVARKHATNGNFLTAHLWTQEAKGYAYLARSYELKIRDSKECDKSEELVKEIEHDERRYKNQQLNLPC